GRDEAVVLAAAAGDRDGDREAGGGGELVRAGPDLLHVIEAAVDLGVVVGLAGTAVNALEGVSAPRPRAGARAVYPLARVAAARAGEPGRRVDGQRVVRRIEDLAGAVDGADAADRRIGLLVLLAAEAGDRRAAAVVVDDLLAVLVGRILDEVDRVAAEVG